MAVVSGAGLLARKGQARPAMRSPRLAPGSGPQDLDDLGWNDMGDALPPVLVERAWLAARLAEDGALTVPVDAARHRRLHAAAVVTGRSAQDLVGEALDTLFDALPDVRAESGGTPR